MKNIGIITYHFPHLKTQQIFDILVKKYPAESFTFYALPFVSRKKRDVVFKHRPDQESGCIPQELAEKYGIRYVQCQSDLDIGMGCDLYLLLGAGLLSAEAVKGKKIINCHPGIIPISRGLDAFKWAVYDLAPIGNTLHYIDAEVDAGEIISVLPTPVYESDTLETFAERHYKNEIEMMANFAEYLKHPINDFKNISIGMPHMRMKREIEKRLSEKFALYKERYAKQ